MLNIFMLRLLCSIFSCCVTNFLGIYQDFSTTFKTTSRKLKTPAHLAGFRGQNLKFCMHRHYDDINKYSTNANVANKIVKLERISVKNFCFCLQLVEKHNIYLFSDLEK